MMTPASSKRDWIKLFESFSFLGNDHTLRRRNFVSGLVITIGVCHVLPPKAIHLASLWWSDTGIEFFQTLGAVTPLWRKFNGINCAAMKDQAGEFGYIRSIFVIDSIFATISSPIRPIPYCSIQGHWLRGELSTHCCCSLKLSYGDIVNIKSAKKITTIKNKNMNRTWIKPYLQPSALHHHIIIIITIDVDINS